MEKLIVVSLVSIMIVALIAVSGILPVIISAISSTISDIVNNEQFAATAGVEYQLSKAPLAEITFIGNESVDQLANTTTISGGTGVQDFALEPYIESDKYAQVNVTYQHASGEAIAVYINGNFVGYLT